MKKLKFLYLIYIQTQINYFASIFLRKYLIKFWEKKGKSLPPPHVIKQRKIRDLQLINSINLFVETGTYLGDMIAIQRRNFKKLYSIEVDEKLYLAAKKRFKRFANVIIRKGDSSYLLKSIVNEIDNRAIFWLDGHYSAGITGKGETECPIFGELEAILSVNKNHIILIDDARCFIGKGDYPKLEEIKSFIFKKCPNSTISIDNDAIQIVLNFSSL